MMNSTTSLQSALYRPPFIGLLAFVVQALGHTVMILMEEIFGERYVYQSAFLLGGIGAVMLYVGMKHTGEVAGTWLGFFAGTFLWAGWV
jgi:putative Mn2+ efflux pump MntP